MRWVVLACTLAGLILSYWRPAGVWAAWVALGLMTVVVSWGVVVSVRYLRRFWP